MTIKTQRARRVLMDAIAALDKFNQLPVDVDFRHLVVLCCTLIRSVGHVVEAENAKELSDQQKVSSYYNSNIKDVLLFKNFIKGTRDNVLKEYAAYIGWSSITDLNNNHHMEYLVKEGEYKDEDFRNLMSKAIEFWEHHLAKIDKL